MWSPDGSRIAFSSSRSGDRDIFVMNADGSELMTVVRGPGDQRRPSWSPDGSSIAYVSDERFVGALGAPSNVFVADLGAGRSQMLSDAIVGPGRPAWTPDDDRVIFSAACIECREYSTNIVSVSIDGRDRIDVTPSEGVYDAYPVLSPDGTTVLFIRDQQEIEDSDSVTELWSVNSDGTGPQQIRSDLFGGRAPTISPDGRRIVLENYTCAGTPVCLLDSFSGQETQLFEDLKPIEGSVLNMDAPDWGCCPGPGRGGVILENRAGGVTAGENLPPLLDLVTAGGATTAALNAQGVSVEVSELWGGGFQNMIVEADSMLLMAGDNSGVHANTGQWKPSSAGFGAFQQSREVASIGVHPTDADQVWAATTGGVYYSTDGGENWTLQAGPSESPGFRGNNNPGSPPLYSNHPRATGQLVVADVIGQQTYLYGASAEDGLWRSIDNGDTWKQIALDNHRLRAVVQHPTSGALYVASLGTNGNNAGGGIHEICEPDGCTAPTSCTENCSTRLTTDNQPKKPEELVFDPQGERLWCACGPDGVWRSNKNNYTVWNNFSIPGNNAADRTLPTTNLIWAAIDIGDFDGTGSQDVVAGAVAVDGNGSEDTLQWTPLTTIDWKDVVADTTDFEDRQVCATANKKWWFADPGNNQLRPNLLVDTRWDTGFVKFIGDDDVLYITGRSGAWRMKDDNNDGTLVGDTPCPFVKGLASTANRAIDAGPAGGTDNHVIIGNTDFDALSSTNGLKAVTNHSNNGGIVMHNISGLTVGYDVDFNSGDATPYALIGAGNRDKERVDSGDVYNAVAETHSGNKLNLNKEWRVVGVGAATRPSGPVGSYPRYEVAVVSELTDPNPMNGSGLSVDRGIWHRSGGNGTWDFRTNLIGDSSGDTPFTRVSIEWGRNNSATGYSPFVFLLDRETGIWRSGDWGLNWNRIWGDSLNLHFPDTGSDADFVGFMALNPTDQNELVFSSALGLYQINSAKTCTLTSCIETDIAVSGMPMKFGPVAFSPDDGQLVVSSRVVNANDTAEIWVRDGTGTFVPKVDNDPIFNSAAFALTDMAVTHSRDIFISSRGQGAIVISGAVPEN